MHPLRLLALSIPLLAFPAQAELSPQAESSVQQRGHLDGSRQKFEQRKRGHVAFLGGSITQNARGHTAMVPAWLEERFPDTEFTFTNAGLSSTCSTTGAFRLQEHVLSQDPVDLLIVEFAVNDDQDAGHARREALRGMEGIIRQVRRHNPSGDILMVHFANPGIVDTFRAGETPVSVAAHEAVAQHYEITSINVGAALAADALSWEEYGGTHPKEEGYRLVSDMIIHALEKGWSQPEPQDPAPHLLPAPLDPGNYEGARFLDPTATEWMGGWTTGPVSRALLPRGGLRDSYLDWPLTVSNQPGAQMTITFRGQAIGAFVLAGPDAGILETSIDGGPFQPIDLFHRFSKGLNYPRTVLFASDLDSGLHQMTLRVAERSNEAPSGGNQAAILHFVVNE